MGAKTLAIDASSSNIKIASAHASQDPFLSPRTPAFRSPLEYRHTTSDALIEEGKTFDVVASMEVVEHVDNPADFVRSCAALVKVRPSPRISKPDVDEPRDIARWTSLPLHSGPYTA
jgi:polyprenyldihydroxybenzoate methyltransferase/3-demethylubiquinol 3-O-methyltransferase